MKRTLIALALIMIMVVAFAVPAMASEADAIEAAIAKVAAKFPQQSAKAVDDAQAWLAANGDDIKEGVGAKVAAQIDAALATIGTSEFGKLSAADQKKVLDNVTAAAELLGLKAELSADRKTLTIIDGDTKFTYQAGAAVKNTGLDTMTIAIIAICVTALFGAAIVTAVATRKKGQAAA